MLLVCFSKKSASSLAIKIMSFSLHQSNVKNGTLTLQTPGVYTLAENLQCIIVIGAYDVTLDLNCLTLHCGGVDVGIQLKNVCNFVLQNGVF